MRWPDLRAFLLASCATVLAVLLVAGGCGGSVLPGDVEFETWDGSGTPQDPAVAGEFGENGNGGVVEGETVVRGAPDERDGSILCVDPARLVYGDRDTERVLAISNCGSGELQYTVTTGVAWLSAHPSVGQIAGATAEVTLIARREGLSPGHYGAVISVQSDDGEVCAVTVALTVGEEAPEQPETPAELVISTTAIDFGDVGTARGFTLSNVGGGALSYNVSSDVEWLQVQPTSGTLTVQADEITVSLDRAPMYVGTATGTLHVQTDIETVTIEVAAEKPLTTPKIIPWLEVNQCTDEEIENCVAGIAEWRHLTDAVMVTSTPGREWVYTELQERCPEVTIYPGVKTVYRLGEYDFDNYSGWTSLAASCEASLALTDSPVYCLESETALQRYYWNQAEIDMEALQLALSQLPTGPEYYIWPGIVPHRLEQSLELMAAMQDVLDLRIFDLTLGGPELAFDNEQCDAARAALWEMAENPPVAIIWFGGQYWAYEDINTVMGLLVDYEVVYVYPGMMEWVNCPQVINDLLW